MKEKEIDPVFSKKPIDIEKGKGVYLYDSEDNEYLDFGASYGVAAVGHSNDFILKAIEKQFKKLSFVHGSHPNSTREKLMNRLIEITPEKLNKVFLANSGTEAVEAAIKFSRASSGSSKIIAAKRGFHGRTMGSTSATWKPKYRKPFEPLVPGFNFVGYNDSEDLKETVDNDTACVLIEPIQGEGGIYPAEKEFLKTARDLCSDFGAFLVFDEIQTGLGRTGNIWSFEHYGIKPDALTSAKALGGGLPASALICGEEMSGAEHGGTYSGNPVVSASSKATLDYILKNELQRNAAEMGEIFINKLKNIDSDEIVDIRGRGLIVGVQVRHKSPPLLYQLAEKGVLALTSGINVMRFLPPLVVEEKHIEKAVEKIEEVV